MPLQTLENDVRQTYKQQTFNFSDTNPGSGLGLLDAPLILNKYGVTGQQIDFDQIKERLKEGPVMAVKKEGVNGHAVLILNMTSDTSFSVYDSQVPGGSESLSKNNIRPDRIVAVRPLGLSSATPNGLVHHHLQ